MDGGYVNAPDYHNKGTGKDIGLREFNSNVLVHNWFEERTPVREKVALSHTFFILAFQHVFCVFGQVREKGVPQELDL